MMRCEDVRPELLGYHLGASERPLRDELDAHVTECRGCLAAYLGHKRASEDAGAFDERPARRVHDQLRARVARRAQTFGGPRRSWVLAFVAAAALVVAWFWRMSSPAPTPALLTDTEHGLVDSATRQAAANVL